MLRVVHHLHPIDSVRTGGQSGADEAGAKAAARLGIKTIVHAPGNFMYKDGSGKTISSEQRFKDRFLPLKSVDVPKSPEVQKQTLDQRREALATSATKDPVKRTEKCIMNEASSLRIEVTEDLLERIEADIKANGLVMAPEVTRMIAKDYLNMRNALSDYDHNKNLNQILPNGVAAGDSFLATQLNLSNRIIVDGETPVSNELQRLAKADNRIAEIKDTKDYTEFDSVALVASREKILESDVFESDQTKRAMEAGATIITPDVIGRGDLS